MEEERYYTVYMHINKTNDKTYVGMTRQTPKDRWDSGHGYKNSTYFKNAIKKYGWDNFEHIILFENKTKEEAETLEILYIKILLSNNRHYGYNIASGGNVSQGMTEEMIFKASKTRKGKYTRGNSWHAKKVYCDGKIYDCIKDCADFYNIDESLMADWLRGHRGTPEKFIKLDLKYLNEDTQLKPQKRPKRKVICDEKVFETIKECADFFNVNGHTMAHWLNGRTKTRKEFYDMGLKFLDSDFIPQPQPEVHRGNVTKVICDCIIYDCIKDCSDKYGVNRSTMGNWLSGFRTMPQEFKDLGLDYYIEN